MAEDEDELEGLNPELKEFGKNLCGSSKDNFLQWALERLAEQRERFSWTTEETAAVLVLMSESWSRGGTEAIENVAELRHAFPEVDNE
jgi:hypothetical protein